MMTDKKRVFWVGGMLLMLLVLYFHLDASGEIKLESDPLNLAMKNNEKIRAQVNTIEKGYHDTKSSLIIQLKDVNGSAFSHSAAASLLGSLRYGDKYSVNTLIDVIDLQGADDGPRLTLPLWGPYPAQEALVSIGSDAVPKIIDRLKGEKNVKRRALLVSALAQIEDPKYARLRLEDAANATTNSDEKAQLNACMSLVK